MAPFLGRNVTLQNCLGLYLKGIFASENILGGCS